MPSLPSSLVVLMTAALAYAAPASAASAGVIGVVAPKSGPYALLGAQVLAGARAAAAATGDKLVEVDESCDEAGGAAAAKALTDGGASIAVGFLCVETLTAAMPVLASHNIAAITISVRSPIVMEDALRNGWPLFRMAPSEKAEADKVAEVIGKLWKADPIAFVDDGTIYGRELVNAVRQKLEPIGITPVFTDTMRPGQEQQIALVRRLQKAGATHVLIGAERNDVAIVARDAASENIPLTVLGGDTMQAANRPVPLRDGALAVSEPPYDAQPGTNDVVAGLERQGVEAEGNVLPAYAAIQIASQALASTGSQSGKPGTLSAALAGHQFRTVIGSIGFTDSHELEANPYRLLEWRGNAFVPLNPEGE
ncbi:ABC transporter substrate-binding protein [Neorhizobium sp. NCHU2750]|uniref:ABC transporter substrate-binding protein n=1 Tax=Neorhizobium sp. NCHU2750 TaxID=1825976 RepID=UPI000E762853|nr:branched-chain amino acid ABC transporter substrate-binding protein [Neorhizobium sp. NCHU2750]